MANVAQLVEPRFVVPVVVGSSPIVRPRLEKAPFGVLFGVIMGLELKFVWLGKAFLKPNSLEAVPASPLT